MKRTIFFAIVLLGVGFTISCQQASTHTESADPLYIVIGYDLSMSADPNGIPKLTMVDVDALVATIKRVGGVIAMAVIKERSYQPIIRLNLEPLGELGAASNIRQQGAQVAQQAQAITDFRVHVEGILRKERSARQTDLYGAVSRLTLFFSEPTIPSNAQRVALLVTDGQHDTKFERFHNNQTPKPITLPADLHVIAVGIEPGFAEQLFGRKVALFEAVAPAVTYLDQLSSGGE